MASVQNTTFPSVGVVWGVGAVGDEEPPSLHAAVIHKTQDDDDVLDGSH